MNIPTEGIFAVYKELGMTSHDAVDIVRRTLGEKRVGHAGTLDPYATGVLVIGVGRPATRLLGQIGKSEKEYITRVKLGWRSTTEDREGTIEQVEVAAIPSREQVAEALEQFQGIISQQPPVFSAIKVRGRPAYRFARANKKVELAAREVEIKEIELLSYEWPTAEIRMVTGPGVYVRAVARDLGDALGVGGYIEELERTRVGSYTKEAALRLRAER